MGCQDLFTGGRIRNFHESFRFLYILCITLCFNRCSVFSVACCSDPKPSKKCIHFCRYTSMFRPLKRKSSSSATFKVNRIVLVCFFSLAGQQEKRVCSLASCIILYAVQTRVSSSLSTIRETNKPQQTNHTSSLEFIAVVTQACMRIKRKYIHTTVANFIWVRRRLVSLLRACACMEKKRRDSLLCANYVYKLYTEKKTHSLGACGIFSIIRALFFVVALCSLHSILDRMYSTHVCDCSYTLPFVTYLAFVCCCVTLNSYSLHKKIRQKTEANIHLSIVSVYRMRERSRESLIICKCINNKCSTQPTPRLTYS